MAKKRKTSTAMTLSRPTAPQTIIVRPASTPKKRRNTSRAMTFAAPRGFAKKAKHHARRAVGAKASLTKTLGGIALAAGLIGLAEKSGLMDKLPTVPMIGKKGVVALGAFAIVKYAGGGEIVRDIAVAATALATYQLGKENKIDGYY